LKVFEAVLTVEPPTEVELISSLRQEAWKDKIEIDPDAADLLIQACLGRSDILLTQLRRVCGVVPQIKQTNRPRLTRQEVFEAFQRLRIKLPANPSVLSKLNIQNLGGQDFERVIKELLHSMGFHAELTEVTGDGGIDIIAKLDKPLVGGRYLFQCKRYASNNLHKCATSMARSWRIER
jgi:hypothetical protein